MSFLSRCSTAKDESTPKKGSAADVFALEKEVEELATRIESHRQEVPKLIAQQLSEHLQQIRPSTSSDPPETGMLQVLKGPLDVARSALKELAHGSASKVVCCCPLLSAVEAGHVASFHEW
jgi:hypothetical protein